MFCLGVRGGPDVKFFSGIRVKLRDMLVFGVLSCYRSSFAPLYLAIGNRACMHVLFYTVFVLVAVAS